MFLAYVKILCGSKFISHICSLQNLVGARSNENRNNRICVKYVAYICQNDPLKSVA